MTYVKGKVSEEVKEQFKIASKKYDGGMGALIGDLIIQYLNDRKVDTSDESTLEKRDATIEGLKDKTMMQEATITEQSLTIKQLENEISSKNNDISLEKYRENKLELMRILGYNPKGFKKEINDEFPFSTIISDVDKLKTKHNEQIGKIVQLEKELSELGNRERSCDDGLERVAKYLGQAIATPDYIIEAIDARDNRSEYNEEILTLLGLQQTDAFDDVSFKDCLSGIKEQMDNNVLIHPDTFYPIGTALGIGIKGSKTEYVSACLDDITENIDNLVWNKAQSNHLKQISDYLNDGVNHTAFTIIEILTSHRRRIADLETELKSVASHLGVPDTSKHIIQRIEECRSEVRNHINKLKARITQVKTIAENKHKQLQGYVTQGFIGRLFREIPKPCGHLDWNGDGEKPEATTLDESVIGQDKVNA